LGQVPEPRATPLDALNARASNRPVTAPDGYGTYRRQRARRVSYGVDHRFSNLPEGTLVRPLRAREPF
jgi:hypothetical protein